MIKEIQIEVQVDKEMPKPYGNYCILHELTLRTKSGKRIVVMLDIETYTSVSRNRKDDHILLAEYVNFEDAISVMMFDENGGFGGVPTVDDYKDIEAVSEAKINTKYSYEIYNKYGKRHGGGGTLIPQKILSLDIKLSDECEYDSISEEIVLDSESCKDTTITSY